MFQTECIFAFIRLYVLALICCNEMHGNAISSLNLNDGQADGFQFFLHLISIPFSKQSKNLKGKSRLLLHAVKSAVSPNSSVVAP